MSSVEASLLPDLDRPIEYSARSFGNRGRARLRVWHGRQVAVLSEPEDNPGASITNAAEDAWGVVAQVLALPIVHPSWTLVEHYPATSQRSDTLDVVTFAGFDGQRFRGPSWCPGILVDGLAWLRAVVAWDPEPRRP